MFLSIVSSPFIATILAAADDRAGSATMHRPMPVITKISEQRRRANRRNIFLDGAFAFGCNLNVVAKFRLREGMSLTDEEVRAIEFGEVKQECFDSAMRFLES